MKELKNSIKLPKDVMCIFKEFKKSGYECYLVGGCIRNYFLNIKPKDYDFTTNATPDQIMEVFSKYEVIPTGIKHGTVSIIINSEAYEITTYRVDGKYSDNIRPDSVTFTRSLKEDLFRRDFTINAIAYSNDDGVKDFFYGIDDIEKKVIKTVGNPKDRFSEDFIRILRGIRFSSVFGFKIEENTRLAMHELAKNIKTVSNEERIQKELMKILSGDNVKYALFEFYDILAVIFPEIKDTFGFKQNTPYHLYDVYTHTVKAIDASSNDPVLRLALLFHDISKPQTYTEDDMGVGHFYEHANIGSKVAETSLRRMKFDNKTINTVVNVIKYHASNYITKSSVKRLLAKIGEDDFNLLIKLKYADKAAQSDYNRKENIDNIDKTKMLLDEVINDNLAIKITDLNISGKDIMSILNLRQGKRVGEVLEVILEEVIEENINNDKKDIISFINKKYVKGEKNA